MKLYERLGGPGRVELVSAAQAADSPQTALALLQAGGPTVVEAAPATVAGWGLTGGAPGRATLRSYAPERIVVETESDGAGLLVLRDAFYPGWRATIDGAPAEIYPADILLRGVAVLPGRHEVVFVYDPPAWRWGRILSGGGILLWLLLWGWGRLNRKP